MQAFSSSDATKTTDSNIINTTESVNVADNVVVIESKSSSVGGRKSEDVAELVELSSDELSSQEDVSSDEEEEEEEDSDYESDEEEEEEEEEEEKEFEEFIQERRLILGDAWKLKKAAEFFLHPEKPVEEDGFASGRAYFARPSGPEVESMDEMEEREQILAEMKALKAVSAHYLHPECPVETSDNACARCFFSRASAPEYDEEDDDEERERIMQDLAALKKMADFHLHPEKPVAVDPTVFGRNYFSRASAEDKDTFFEAAQRNLVLAEMAQMKKLALDYLHPELPAVDGCADPTVFGRNYFMRASAPEQEEDEYADEREVLLEEMKELKQAATDYMHPERSVTIDSTDFGRNYFSRDSAPEKETFEDAEERARILADASALKRLASAYMHPELPVMSTDPMACGRNYFSRPSAAQYEDEDADEERDLILADLAALKQAAADYMYPERPVSVDPTFLGRNYFGRASATDKESFYEAEQRALVLAEMAELKKVATNYLHPELPVRTDAAVFGRNFYSRPSAPEYDDEDDAAEREAVMADLAALKQGAVDFMHPEYHLSVDPTCFSRNYFGRASEPDKESFYQAEQRALVLAEMAELKKVAADYLHPEKPLPAMDSTAFGRNYFARASAPEQETTEDSEERAHVLEEALQLKMSAAAYMHPERPVKADATAYGRNYFSRASAPEEESWEEDAERARILAETSALKTLAVHYLHPEIAVQTADPYACARNYFGRASALGHTHYIHSTGYSNQDYHGEEQSHDHNEYGHFEMDEDELFHDMRQSIVLPGNNNTNVSKIQSNKMGSDEEGELSRSPSSVMLFTGAMEMEGDDHPRLPTMG